MSGYTKTDNDTLKLLDTALQRTVYMVLAQYGGSNGYCFPTMKRIAEEAKVCLTSVKKALKQLVQKGIISIKNRFRSDGGRTSNQYILNKVKETNKNAAKSSGINKKEHKKSSQCPATSTENKNQTCNYNISLINNCQQENTNIKNFFDFNKIENELDKKSTVALLLNSLNDIFKLQVNYIIDGNTMSSKILESEIRELYTDDLIAIGKRFERYAQNKEIKNVTGYFATSFHRRFLEKQKNFNNINKTTKYTNSFNNFQSTEYDLEELEKKIVLN